MDNIYENIEKHNLIKERKILIVFLDIIPDTLKNKNLQQRATEVFIRSRNRDICLVL